MNRINAKPVQIGDKKTRYAFQIFDDPTEPGTVEAERRMFGFLQDLIDQPVLMQAGYTYVRDFHVYHDGTCWVLSGQVEVDNA